MGKGKGSVEYWVAQIKPGQMLFFVFFSKNFRKNQRIQKNRSHEASADECHIIQVLKTIDTKGHVRSSLGVRHIVCLRCHRTIPFSHLLGLLLFLCTSK
jgi:hypothetical protein